VSIRSSRPKRTSWPVGGNCRWPPRSSVSGGESFITGNRARPAFRQVPLSEGGDRTLAPPRISRTVFCGAVSPLHPPPGLPPPPHGRPPALALPCPRLLGWLEHGVGADKGVGHPGVPLQPGVELDEFVAVRLAGGRGLAPQVGVGPGVEVPRPLQFVRGGGQA